MLRHRCCGFNLTLSEQYPAYVSSSTALGCLVWEYQDDIVVAWPTKNPHTRHQSHPGSSSKSSAWRTILIIINKQHNPFMFWSIHLVTKYHLLDIILLILRNEAIQERLCVVKFRWLHKKKKRFSGRQVVVVLTESSNYHHQQQHTYQERQLCHSCFHCEV